jgi:hypothetical protein
MKVRSPLASASASEDQNKKALEVMSHQHLDERIYSVPRRLNPNSIIGTVPSEVMIWEKRGNGMGLDGDSLPFSDTVVRRTGFRGETCAPDITLWW